MHMQDLILEHVKATAIAAATDAGGNVVIEGVDPVPANTAPALRISAGPETVEAKTLSYPRTQQRTFDVVVDLLVAHKDDYRARAGRLLAQLEQALCATPAANTVNGRCPSGLHLVANDPDRDGNAAQVFYTIRTLWRVVYVTKENAPQGTP